MSGRLRKAHPADPAAERNHRQPGSLQEFAGKQALPTVRNRPLGFSEAAVGQRRPRRGFALRLPSFLPPRHCFRRSAVWEQQTTQPQHRHGHSAGWHPVFSQARRQATGVKLRETHRSPSHVSRLHHGSSVTGGCILTRIQRILDLGGLILPHRGRSGPGRNRNVLRFRCQRNRCWLPGKVRNGHHDRGLGSVDRRGRFRGPNAAWSS